MDSLTESEIVQITRLQRDAAVHRLSRHFAWTEFYDERRCFHQEFVCDVAMFAAASGFPWTNVIQAAVIAKGIFPQLNSLEVPRLLLFLKDALSESLPSLTPFHRKKLTQYLADTCITRRRLLQAVVGGAANLITQLDLELLLPPTPCPLEMGVDVHRWELQLQQAQLTSALQQKEEELRNLRDESRVTLGKISVPAFDQRDTQEVLKFVRVTVKATEGQMLASLNRETCLLDDILQLKLQLAQLTTGRLYNPFPAHTSHSN